MVIVYKETNNSTQDVWKFQNYLAIFILPQDMRPCLLQTI